MTLAVLYAGSLGTIKTRDSYVGHTIRRGGEAQASHLHREGLNRIRKRDPGFDEKAFLTRVRDGFLKTQTAWARQDMRPVQAFLSDGVFERFEIYLTMQKALGIRNAMENVNVTTTRVLQVESDQHFDTLHVRIDAAAVDYDIELNGNRVVRNAMKRSEAFTEIWSFLRRPGVKTLSSPGLMEGSCPNCGAPLKITDAAKCGSCDSWVNSGDYDWVLSEITQSCEWRPLGSNRDIEGKAAMEALDPAVNVQFLEDRASVAFWRWQLSHWEPEAKSFKSVASKEAVKALLDERGNGQILYKNAAVGSVETLAFEPGSSLDKAHVMVRWSGEKFRVVDGSAQPEGEAVCSHVFIFGRAKGVKTNPKGGLHSTRCPGCGSPPSDRAIAVCEYCSTPFNDGSRNWTLIDIMPRGLWKKPFVPTPSSPGQFVTPPVARAERSWDDSLSPSTGLAILVAGMVMDGEIDDREMTFASGYAKKNGIPGKRLDSLVASARAGTLEVPSPQTPVQAADYMRGLIEMSLADGVVSSTEQKTLLAFGDRMKLSNTQVELMVRTEKTKLYRAAKNALRGQHA